MVKGRLDHILGICSVAAFIVVCVLMLHYMFAADRENDGSVLEGSGTETDPYVIGDLEDYLWFADQFNNFGTEYAFAYVRLDTDISLEGENSGVVIGSEEKELYFAGVFDGGGHSIRGLRYDGVHGALFPLLFGSVHNLEVVDAKITGKYASGIVGELGPAGSIVNCMAQGSFEGKNAAGICSVNNGHIENCVCNTSVGAIYKSADESRVSCVYSTGAIEQPGSDGGVRSIEEIALEMNENVKRLIPDCDYNMWAVRDGEVFLDENKLHEPRLLCTRVSLGGQSFEIKGFFSFPERRWFMVLPESCRQESYSVRVITGSGTETVLNMDPQDRSFTLDGTEYEIEYLFFDDVPVVMAEFYDDNELSYLYRSKDLFETGSLFVADKDGKKDMSTARLIFSGRGNDSYSAIKKGYSMELPAEMSIAGMEPSLEYNLISGYRDNCFLTYMYTRDLYKGLALPFAHDYRPVNLYINGRYQGLYFLTEKMTISKSSFDLEDLHEKTKRMNGLRLYEYPKVQEGGKNYEAKTVYYNLPNEPDDVTGGYLMEVTMLDYALTDSRFVTDRGVIISSKDDKNLGRAQMDYISNLFKDYEEALTSENGYNSKGKYYADYIDMESFADQWILFELAADLAMDNSVYYYKDSDRRGDGKIHAVWYWDAEHALMDEKRLKTHFLMRRVEKGSDCSVNKVNTGNFWTWIYAHEDFRRELNKEWKEKFSPALHATLEDELRDNSRGAGTFKWYKLSYSPSFEINDRSFYDTDYRAKCDQLSERLAIRLECLDRYFTDEK